MNLSTTFRPPRSGENRKRKRVKTKTKKVKRRALTDKERQEAAREHWELNHGMPEILGHRSDHIPFIDPNQTTVEPIHFLSLMKYFDNLSTLHENLKNLD